MGETNLSSIRYCSLWEWVEEPMPPSWICSIPHWGETPHEFLLQCLTNFPHPCLISTWPKEWCTIVSVRHCRRNSWGVFPRYGIEQIREGGIGSLAHSQSKKYLIGKRFVSLTIIFLAIILSSMFDLILFLLIKILSLLN